MQRSSRQGFTHIDLYISIVLTILFLTFLLLGTVRTRGRGYNITCGSNLRQIGQAMQLYANENGGNLARTLYDPADPNVRAYTGVSARNPFAADGPQPNDVTAAFYLLLRTQDFSASVFICPVPINPEPFDVGGKGKTVQDYSNFPSEKNLSYSIANPYPSPAARSLGYRWTNTLKADFALAADMNPGTPELWSLTMSDGISKQWAGNTKNHFGGQNVLYGDGHVEFQHTSFAGVNNDNIYGPAGLVNAGLSNETIDPRACGNSFYSSPTHKDDSVLLPIATADPGGPLVPSDFKIWWYSGAPRSIVGLFLVLILMSWGTVRWIWPALCALVRAMRNQSPEQRRMRQGLCGKCGYDLRASPDRCPECGDIRQPATEVH